MSESSLPAWNDFEFDVEQACRSARLDLDYIQHGGSGLLDRQSNQLLKPMTVARRVVKTAGLAGPTGTADQHPDVLSSWDAERAQRAAAVAALVYLILTGALPDGAQIRQIIA